MGALLALTVAAGLGMLIEALRVELPGDDTLDTAVRAMDEQAERVHAAPTIGADSEEAAAVAVAIAAEIAPLDPHAK